MPLVYNSHMADTIRRASSRAEAVADSVFRQFSTSHGDVNASNLQSAASSAGSTLHSERAHASTSDTEAYIRCNIGSTTNTTAESLSRESGEAARDAYTCRRAQFRTQRLNRDQGIEYFESIYDFDDVVIGRRSTSSSRCRYFRSTVRRRPSDAVMVFRCSIPEELLANIKSSKEFEELPF